MHRPGSLTRRSIAAFLVVAAMPAHALQCKATSGPDKRALVELYTSEGCSSCPPADEWLSRYGRERRERVVPIAFHVDYWDLDGWKDPYSDARYTRRQDELSKATGARFVYTPQVVVGGRDMAEWRNGWRVPLAVFRITGEPAGANLAIDATVADDGSIRGAVDATLPPGARPDRLALVAVAVQDGIGSRVTAGENRGRNLAHDFVARDMASAPLAKTSGHLAFDFKPRANWTPRTMSVAAFVQDRGTGEVLQALSTGTCR